MVVDSAVKVPLGVEAVLVVGVVVLSIVVVPGVGEVVLSVIITPWVVVAAPVDVIFICVVIGCKLDVVVCMIVVVEHELERTAIVFSNCVFNVSKSVFNDCIVSMTDCSVKVALSIISRTSCTNLTRL